MKKVIFAALLVCCIVLCIGCGKPTGMSPEATVRYYFEQWNGRNSENMNSVVDTKLQQDYDFTDIKSIRLYSCEEVKDKETVKYYFENWRWWYDKTTYDIAMVDVTYGIQWVPESEFRTNGDRRSTYFLVKESADSDWIIVAWAG